MIFQREIFSMDLYSECLPLLLLNYQEIPTHSIPLNPDISAYDAMERSGILRIYTARDAKGELIGYSCFVVVGHPHFKGMTQALNDMVFILKEARGFGRQFIHWCGEQLEADGCMFTSIGSPTGHDLGKLLEAEGYVCVEKNYQKRLGVASVN